MPNRLLNGLSSGDLEALRPHLVDVSLPLRHLIHMPGDEADHVYFVESGLVSLITVAGANRIEIGIVGHEGCVGLPAILGAPESLHEAIVQIAGEAKQIRATDLQRCMDASRTLSASLLRFVHVFMAQISQTALANGRNTVEQRLARWLLMAHDRMSGNEIALTHEFLAVMLGVRRPGVTVALHLLEGAHAIRSKRNSITVTDRDKLKDIAGASYGRPEALYERIFGALTPAGALAPAGALTPAGAKAPA